MHKISEAIFVLPGRTILWVQYYFPEKGQLWASRRRKDNVIVQVIYSVGFWIAVIAAVTVFTIKGKSSQ
jgi:hypothetical protein